MEDVWGIAGEETDWDNLFLDFDFSDLGNIFVDDEPEQPQTQQQQSSSPAEEQQQQRPMVVASSWVDEIEKVLMEDDDHVNDDTVEIQSGSDDFLADILVDSPPSSAANGEIVDDATVFQEKNQTQFDTDDVDDPIAKKQRRKLRNRDAAVRSRERKKMYVKDLEMKSKYLEGECRRLNRMLQCFIAENQALRFTLNNKGCAFDTFAAKQESAVLLLESLLLGSLLWLLGIMCLFTLPTLPKSLLEAVPMAKEQKRGPERVAPRGPGSNLVRQSFVKSRRCKASRTKMKESVFWNFSFTLRWGEWQSESGFNTESVVR